MILKAGNDMVILSEQMLIDCGDGDCNGGWKEVGYETIIDQGGIALEEDYHYTAHNGKLSLVLYPCTLICNIPILY